VADFDYDKLDPGIREFVRWLREERILITSDSGDGVSKVGKMDDADLMSVPHVVVKPLDRREVASEAAELWTDMVHLAGFSRKDDIHVDAQYSPIDQVATILVWGSALYNWKPPA
jgi:hypothetical protein